MLLTGEGIHIEHRKMLFSGRGTSQAALCPCWHQVELSSTFSVQYAFHLESFTGKVTEHVGNFKAKIEFSTEDPFSFRVRVLLFHICCLQAEMYRHS